MIGAWTGPRASLDAVEKIEKPCPFLNSNPGLPDHSPFCSIFTLRIMRKENKLNETINIVLNLRFTVKEDLYQISIN
jgi:hypothetical protein